MPPKNESCNHCKEGGSFSAYTFVHSQCYERSTVYQCTESNQTFWTGISLGNNAGYVCPVKAGKPFCWTLQTHWGMTDGGGVQDHARKQEVQRVFEQVAQTQDRWFKPIHIPGPVGSLKLEKTVQAMLDSALQFLNKTNPTLASDCWLCLREGPPRYTAIPAVYNWINWTNLKGPTHTCNQTLPINNVKLSPTVAQMPCLSHNGTLRVGQVNKVLCSSVVSATKAPSFNGSASMCPPALGTIFFCGTTAYPVLPANWSGLCILTYLMPDVGVVPGNQSLPIQLIQSVPAGHKRAIITPLLLGLGVAAEVGTGVAGIGTSVNLYQKISAQLVGDIGRLADTTLELQSQLDSLAAVVLQNRRGLDLLTAKKGGICLYLREECCFYANKSGIVRNKIKQLQEELKHRRKKLEDNNAFLWEGLGEWLPYLLPLLGPVVTLFLILSIGPCVINRLVAFIKQRVNTVQLMVLRSQYAPLRQYNSPQQPLKQDPSQYIGVEP
ncbi:syncytin-1-like [Talpa occidentalis]|uniref:syncytin-1-like n=1 Tax=Talpa occidentalis TaxID=50954 RepID=UPI00188FAF47|nr:syncytin-1-like [Talpa occidentalis]